jgi:hypothetical protein
MNQDARPKPLFYLAVVFVVAALVAFGFRSILFPSGSDTGPGMISKDELSTNEGVEAADANVPTTVKEYTFLPGEKLAPITQT